MSTARGRILEQARALTEGDRNQSYGDPRDNMTCFAQLVDAYINSRCLAWGPDDGLNAVDAAVILCLLKVSRIAVNQEHEDNFVDLAAYAGIAGECAVYEVELGKGS